MYLKITNKILERNQQSGVAKAAQGASHGVIYVFSAPAGTKTAYKLGMTSNLAARMRSHQAAMADGVELLFVFKTDNMKQVEACAKIILRSTQYRKYKEVYQADLSKIKEVIEGCEALIKKVVTLPEKRKQVTGGGSTSEVKVDHFMVLHVTHCTPLPGMGCDCLGGVLAHQLG